MSIDGNCTLWDDAMSFFFTNRCLFTGAIDDSCRLYVDDAYKTILF